MDNDKILNEARDYYDRVVLPDLKKHTASVPKLLRDIVYKTSCEAFSAGWLACYSEKISADMTDPEADNGTV